MEQNTSEAISVAKARGVVIDTLNRQMNRSDLIKECVKALGFSKEILSDTSPESLLSLTRARFGNAIDALIREKYIEQISEPNEPKKVKPIDSQLSQGEEKKIEIAKQSERVSILKGIILDLLAGRAYTRKEIIVAAEEVYNNRYAKAANIGADAGNALSYLLKQGSIKKDEQHYSAIKDNEAVLNNMSKENFNRHTVNLLYKLYARAYQNVKAEDSDGSGDGGVDGRIRFCDAVGFDEVIIIQSKYKQDRKNKNIKVNQIREFAGVLSFDKNATKGIFVTNAKITSEAKQFIDKYEAKPYMFIDGARWLELANECGYIIAEND